MIRRVELSNVRIFEGDGWAFDLTPLTVFCGANSAGKSTILKVPLLLQQSQQNLPLGRDGRLYLAGSRVDFGDYRTFVSHEDTARKVVISLTTDFPTTTSTIDFLRSSKTIKRTDHLNSTDTIAKTALLRCELRFSVGDTRTEPRRGKIGEPNDGVGGTAVLDYGRFQIISDDVELLQWEVVRAVSPTGSQYEVLFPVDYFRKVGGFRIMSAEQKSGQVRFATKLEGIFPFTIVGSARRTPKRHRKSDAPMPEAEEIEAPLPPAMQQALWSLQQTLNNTSYLGPLRSPAKRFYVAYLEASRDLDPTGEFLPYVLRDRAEDRVVNVIPGPQGPIVRQTLSEALDLWVHYLRTGETSPEKDSPSELLLGTTKQVLVQISIKGASGSERYALADSGFGYSQVLPILVRGLLADEGSTFIIEQPELHLNPSLQVRLAEFFVSMVRAGKQVLIETHSEHIVNAIRVLTAEDETGILSERSRIYFIDTSSPRPAVRELSVTKDGTVPDWPRHFFGEAVELTGRLLRAQQRFRAPAKVD